MTDPLAFSASSRYELLVKVASGGMATVYVGRIRGAIGFTRLVAIKRAHPHLLEDAAFARALAAEARVTSMIHHPNVCSVHDVEECDGEILLVMDYVEGTSLAGLATAAARTKGAIPPAIAIRIVLDSCAGLQAAHELTNDAGRPLALVHRDVSPHNILVGLDGVARLADFGIARVAAGSMTLAGAQTTTGILKGKVGYMAPEYIETGKVDARADVFALGVVAWEALTQRRLFRGQSDIDTLRLVMAAEVPALSSVVPALGTSLDEIFARVLARAPNARYQTARDFGAALGAAAQRANLIATPSDVGALVRTLAGPALESRRSVIRTKVPESAEAPQSLTTPVDPVTTTTFVTPSIGTRASAPGAPASAPDPPAPADVPIGQKTLTLPIITPPVEYLRVQPAREDLQREASNTFAAGAAAVTVDSSDRLRAPSSRRFVPLVIAIIAAMVGMTSVGLWMTNARVSSHGREAASSTAPAPSVAPPPPPAASTPPQGTSTPASATTPPPGLPPVAAPVATSPSSSSSAKLPRPTSIVRPGRSGSLDTAPPNPYGKD